MNKIRIELKALLLMISLILSSALQADGCAGKIDIAPAFMHIDILESGRTVKRMDMPGVRGELSYRFWKGLYIKPTFIYGHGPSAKGGMINGTLSIGFCIPLSESVMVSPSLGVGYSRLWTRVDLPQIQLSNLKENFKSLSPLAAVDILYTICPSWRISATIQYGWARTHTSIAHVFKGKSNSKGFNYAFLLEKDLNDHWSVNLGAAYSLSLSKEKHGIRGTGLKLGLAYWF
jgi:hypothetical protein